MPSIFSTEAKNIEQSEQSENDSDDLRTMSMLSNMTHASDYGLDLQALLAEIYITNGRLLHHERVLCMFPEYLQKHFKIINGLMNGEGGLPLPDRYYLSIMAVSCYDCDYLLKI